MHDAPDFLSIKEFAALLKVHRNTVRRCILRGRINAIKIGGIKNSVYRIPKSEIQRLSITDLEKIIDNLIEKRMIENNNKKT